MIVIVVIMVIMAVMVVRTNPGWIDDTPNDTDINSQDLQLLVTGMQDSGLLSQPTFNSWEIADELWEDPRYISDNISFSFGTITFHTEGIYEVNVGIIVGITNYSLRDIDPLVRTRIVRGAIAHRYDYTLDEFVSNVGQTMYIPHESTGVATLLNTAIINITSASITDGRNTIMIQYMVQLPPEQLNRPGESLRIGIQRNMDNMLSNIYVTNLN